MEKRQIYFCPRFFQQTLSFGHFRAPVAFPQRTYSPFSLYQLSIQLQSYTNSFSIQRMAMSISHKYLNANTR